MKSMQSAKRKIAETIRRFGGWKNILIRGGAVLATLLVVVQLLYPSDRLLPLTTIDGTALGWKNKSEAAKQLNVAYDNHRVAIYMGPADKPVSSPKLADAKMSIDNTSRVNAMNYPWYLRLVPTSILWGQPAPKDTPAPVLQKDHSEFVEKKLMSECRKNPTNAGLTTKDGKLELIKAVPGGECEKTDVIASLKKVRPKLDSTTKVRVQLTVLQPTIADEAALAKKKQIEMSIGDGVQLTVGSEQVMVAGEDVISWLDVTELDGALVASVNQERSSEYMDKTVAPKVAVQPGVSYITTQDFTETSRINGAPGAALDVPGTLRSLADVINGKQANATAMTVQVPPREEYTRSYSPTDAGLSALLANYAKDHSGTFGISLIELDGKKRRADFQGDKQFVTASTYKLFVAYSVLKRIDNGQMSWDTEGSCFNKMISNSDNPCSEDFLRRVGLSVQTKEIQAIGLKNSNFIKEGGPYTTANDLSLLLGMIATGQNFSSTGQARLLAAMKAGIHRQGIPSGAAGTVANKVGFLNGLFHDAAIVYGPNGTYVLAILTEGSNWTTIADLAKQIDTLRAK